MEPGYCRVSDCSGKPTGAAPVFAGPRTWSEKRDPA